MAARFWVGGTGTWDASDTTHWAATSGGAGGQSVPVAADTVTFDGSSGTGTITVNHASLTITSLTMSALTGGSVLDFATNDNNITITSSFTNNGSGTRTLNMGDGTWTMSANSGNAWIQNGATNLTFNANGSTLQFTGTSTSTIKTVTLGAFTYNIVTFAGSAAGYALGGATTIGTWNISAPTTVQLPTATMIISNAMTLTGSSGSPIALQGGTFGTSSTLQLGAASTATWCSFRDITTTTSSMTATNSFDLGRNTFSGGGSISAPSGGSGGGQRVFGG